MEYVGIGLRAVATIIVWTSDKKQRLGDRVAGTVVVPAREAAPAEKNTSPVTRL